MGCGGIEQDKARRRFSFWGPSQLRRTGPSGFLKFEIGGMMGATRIILTGRNLPKMVQPKEPAPLTIDEKAIAHFARVLEQAGILKPEKPD